MIIFHISESFLSVKPIITQLILPYSLSYYLHGAASFLETNRFSFSQEIPGIFCNPKVHYHIHKNPSPLTIMSQLDPNPTPTSHFQKIHLNIILQSKSGSPKWSISFRFPTKPLYTTIFSPYALHVPPIKFSI